MIRALSAEARKFHVAVVGTAATVAVAFLPVEDPWPTVAQAITAVATAFGVYWTRNELDPVAELAVDELAAVDASAAEWWTLPGRRVHDRHDCLRPVDHTGEHRCTCGAATIRA